MKKIDEAVINLGGLGFSLKTTYFIAQLSMICSTRSPVRCRNLLRVESRVLCLDAFSELMENILTGNKNIGID